MSLWPRVFAFYCASIICTHGVVAGETPGRYLLGPQDRINIRVYDLRRNTGEAYSWVALNGQFLVAADGTVSLPIIGQIKAEGGTPGDLATAIGVALKQAADLAERPAASVEVATYRPFYITGAVQQPGKYEYQPGLTVIQAVSTAQGFVRGSDPLAMQRNALTSRGETQTLAAERVALITRLERLDAEIAGADTITIAEELKNNSDKTRVAQAIRDEQLIFETRRNATKAEVLAIQRNIDTLKSELTVLESKSKTLDRQLELSQSELNLVSDLVSKGLSIAPRRLAAQQSQASFESNRLDVQVAMLRAQQSLARAERDIIDLRARFRREALSEAAETRQKLALNEEKARTAENLLSNAESQMLSSTSDAFGNTVARFEITRGIDGAAKTWVVSEDTSVEPGDVVKVSLQRGRGAQTNQMTETPMVATSPSRSTGGVSPGRSGTYSTEVTRRATENTIP
ncbi:sugar transporter [Methylobacterium mesophilicum SR1.6/6]|uniref:Sugar transporter n=1 Tax=Methylobacterium mesophilicum SR1.6/6 TaxID=908290 RepID=A0A6B9FP38_9HYPH|nr:sugar transporter [Methylobacterium mesophilicum SR1.6/6]